MDGLPATFIFLSAMAVMLLPNVLFATAKAHVTEDCTLPSCPLPLKFEVKDYNIDVVLADPTRYGNDLVEGTNSKIVLRLWLFGNITADNFANSRRSECSSITLYFDMDCYNKTDGHILDEHVQGIGPQVIDTFESNGRTITELQWEQSRRIPHDAYVCSAQINRFIGRDLNRVQHCVDGLNDLSGEGVWSIPILTRQDSISNRLADLTEKQANINDRMADISDAQLDVSKQAPMWGLGGAILGVIGTLMAAVIGANIGSNKEKNKINVKIKTEKSTPHWLAILRERQDTLMNWFANNGK